MNRKKSTLRSQAGLSLIELLIAFALLGTAATSLFLLGSTSAHGNVRSKEHSAAASLAIAKIEQLKNLPFDDAAVASGSDTGPLDAAGDSGGTFLRNWTVTGTTISGVTAKNVSVTVTGTPGVTVTLATTLIDPPMIAADFYEGFPTVASRSWSSQ